MDFKNKQEEFWAGAFGNQYIERNDSQGLLASNIMLFSKIISRTRDIKSVIEFGANIGLNLLSIKALIPNVELSGVEINDIAVKELREAVGTGKAYHDSIFNFKSDYKRDFVLSKTFLIHIQPDLLNTVYDLFYETSNKYICIAEYYNPTPVEVTYRGHEGVLFKRNFAGDLLDRFSDLALIDYGFAYRRDNYYSAFYDDINWFLLEKC